MNMELLSSTFYDNSLQTWLIALSVAVLGAIALRIFQALGVKQIERLAKRTATTWDDAFVDLLRHTKGLFLLIVALFAGSLTLTLPEHVRETTQAVVIVALLIQAGVWLNAAIKFWVEGYRQRKLKEDPASVTTMSALSFVGRLVLWSVVLLLILDNLGVDVTALVAGLGVGGIAVALAVQNILGDLFASLSIVLDKPFTVGDFLIIGDYMGSVEYIGLKTTRLRSLSGEQLIFSNTDMLGSRIRNYGRMYERRVAFNIGVTYQTTRDQLTRIPGIIREAIEAQENTRFDRSHFKEYGNFSINFETVYYVLGPDYNIYMDIQQAINLHIHERFEAEGIEFAYPTQTLFLQNQPAAS
ncbi:MAG: mechanosensitive ion channel family protein [Chromatiales bacterium]|jgi:small-conductance mechanosensitive channel